jgi:hypothetical protein
MRIEGNQPTDPNHHLHNSPSDYTQTDLSGFISSLDIEMGNIKADPSGFLGGLMGQTPQFNGFLDTMQNFLNAGGASVEIQNDFSKFQLGYNQLQTSFNQTGKVDGTLVSDLLHDWNSVIKPEFTTFKMTEGQFIDGVKQTIANFARLVPSFENSENNTFRALGMIAFLSDAQAFTNSSDPNSIKLPQLNLIYEDMQTICTAPENNKTLAYEELCSTDLPALKDFYHM